jgi:iron complex transport system ATP-binding protein
LLEFKNITVFKDEKKVLDSITLSIDEGEHIAILGPNGSGKSSLIKTITREYYPVIQDENIVFKIWGMETWDVFKLRTLLGVVSNDLQNTFTRDITGWDAIISGFFSSVGLYNREVTPEMIIKANDVLRFLDIAHLKDRKMTRMSSGEARRFLIGRALIHDPKALILDEPTNSLDLYAFQSFRKTLRKIAQSDTRIILVTHNLPDIIPEISRVILIKNGKFCRDGPKEEILTDKNIGDLFSVPVQIRQEQGYYYTVGD